MSLIDLAHLSPLRNWTAFKVYDGGPDGNPTSSYSCDNIQAALISAGWVPTGSVQATGFLIAPFGFGFGGFQGLVCELEGSAYVYYDPTTQTAPSGSINGNAIVPVSNQGNAQMNLIIALNGHSNFMAFAEGGTTILFLSKLPGTAGNNITIGGQPTGSTSIGSISSGGGWIVQSPPLLPNTAQITLQINMATDNTIELTITIGGLVSAPWGLRPGTQWYMAATNYQAVFYNLDPYQAVGNVFQTFLWACTPVIDYSQVLSFVVPFAAFFNRSSTYGGSSTLGNWTYMQVDMWVGGDYTSITGQGQCSWSILMNHSEASPICDPAGAAVFNYPYVMMYVPEAAESRLVGYVPDCFFSSVSETFSAQTVQELYTWLCIATQSEPPGSLWMAINGPPITP